jgi:MoxR-like ATPase
VAQKTKSKKPAVSVIGRQREIDQLTKAIGLGRNVLIEGPVGVGKTFLIQQLLSNRASKFIRVDGDSRYSEQKLTGWFDPPIVLKKGYVEKAFVEGPLLIAMRTGVALFINELNRMPEAVQNILLPAMDEKMIVIPRLGTVQAAEGFLVLATQNPREFTATHMLSEALLDRFEWVQLGYQTRVEELEILRNQVAFQSGGKQLERVLDIVRSTRNHQAIKRGASLRAALAICRLIAGGIDLESACLMSLPSRIELVSSDDDVQDIIRALVANNELPFDEKKKELLT